MVEEKKITYLLTYILKRLQEPFEAEVGELLYESPAVLHS